MLSTILIGVLWVFIVILVIGSLVPLSKVPHGIVRGLPFPREQYLLLSVALAVLVPFVHSGWPMFWALVLLAIVGGVQLLYVLKFTPIWRRQSVSASDDLKANAGARISLLASNVKLSNRAYRRLTTLIQQKSPDIAMAIEVDNDWINALQADLKVDYPHWVEVPKTTGYGLCVMSRLELSDVEVREMITEGVPSIKATVTLRDGRKLRIYVVHPEPPVIDHDTKGRDGEIVQVGMEAADDDLPAIVTGDLNDVAWSSTTRRFQRLSGLLDPRVGRGFYNTFSATMPWMRWPLDHLFHDPKFRLVDMQRLPKIGSDHFPMWFELALAETEKANSDPEEFDPEEREEAEKVIEEERKRDREPIGTDWET